MVRQDSLRKRQLCVFLGGRKKGGEGTCGHCPVVNSHQQSCGGSLAINLHQEGSTEQSLPLHHTQDVSILV